VLDREHPEATFDFGHAAPSSLGGFVRLGTEHILSGLDHLLFLAALLLGSRGLRSLLITITCTGLTSLPPGVKQPRDSSAEPWYRLTVPVKPSSPSLCSSLEVIFRYHPA